MHVVRKVGPVAAILTVVLLSAQAATAQSTSSIALTGGTAGAWTAGTASAPVSVSLTLKNVICPPPAGGSAVVKLSAPDPSPVTGLTFSIPATVTFAIPYNAYTDNGPYTSNPVQVNVTATTTAGVPANHEHKVNVTATFTAGDLTGCQSAAQTTSLSSTATVQVSFKTPMGSGPGGNGTQTTGPGGTNGTTSKPAITLPFAIQVGAIVGVGALAMRRKRQA